MFNLDIYFKLLQDTSANLQLKQKEGDIHYFLVGTSLSHSVAMVGKCSGIMSKDSLELKVDLKGLRKLNLPLTLKWANNSLSFVTPTNEKCKVAFSPTFIEVSASPEHNKFVSILESNPQELPRISFAGFKPIISLAAKTNAMIHFCGDYACYEYNHSCVLQRGECPNVCISGKLLNTLLGISGYFVSMDSSIYFISNAGDLIVCIPIKLPSTPYDFSLIKDGITTEYYEFNSYEAFSVILKMASTYPLITLTPSEGVINLTNDLKEKLQIEFEVDPSKSKVKSKQETISYPSNLVPLLSSFIGGISLYVKSRKIILKKGELFLVYGR